MFLPRCDVLCASIIEPADKYISKDLLNFPGEFSGIKKINRIS